MWKYSSAWNLWQYSRLWTRENVFWAEGRTRKLNDAQNVINKKLRYNGTCGIMSLDVTRLRIYHFRRERWRCERKFLAYIQLNLMTKWASSYFYSQLQSCQKFSQTIFKLEFTEVNWKVFIHYNKQNLCWCSLQ